MTPKKLLLSPYLHITVLIIVILAVFNRTLGSYFLADDFGEVAYVSRIAGGDLGMLVANFTGNYMQIPSMSVWRPWLLVTLLTDFILWHANPVGYYLTNLLYYIGTAGCLYWLIYTLNSNWCKTRRSLAAFFSALVFALSPLHCESISWVVGRVDIACAFYYLLCLNFFILAMRSCCKQRLRWTVLSTASFWLAMWTKEMAIGAPVLAFAIALLWNQKALDLKKSLKVSAPLLASLPVYFALRFMALGTLLGGYTQGIGDAQASNALSHWLDPDTARRLFLPLAYSLYGNNSHYAQVLLTVYTGLLLLVVVRLATMSAPLRWVLFLPLWLATTLAPIYKLWGLGYELEGARFVFFATMPLAAMAPVILFAPHASRASATEPREKLFRRTFAALAIFLLSSVAFCYAKIATKLNLEWVHAGKEVRTFANQSLVAMRERGDKPICLLGIPKRRGGAHMVLNGTTFKILLQKPFVDGQAKADPFRTFDPIIFGNHNYINASRFKQELAATKDADGRERLLVWNSEKQKLASVQFAAPEATPALSLPDSAINSSLHTLNRAVYTRDRGQSYFERITAGDGIYFGGLAISPLSADILAVTFKFKQKPDRQVPFTCTWQAEKQDTDGRTGESQARAEAESEAASVTAMARESSEEQTIYLPLSSNFHWFTQSTVDHLFLQLPPGMMLSVKKVELLRADELAPQLALKDVAQPRTSAIGVFTAQAGKPIDLKVTAPQIYKQSDRPNAKVIIELSKPNAFFENCEGGPAGDCSEAIQERFVRPLGAGTVSLAGLPAGANYELRARMAAPSSGGEPGPASDPIVLRINK